MKRSALALVLVASMLVAHPSNGQASVQGLEFTETGCEGHSDSIARLYTAGLGRVPEQGGFEFWLTEYTSGRWGLPRMARHFVQSPEFQRTYGSLTQDGFIRQLYRNILGRGGEPGGVAFWNQQMSAGMDRGTVLLRFAESQENTANSGTEAPILGAFNSGLTGPWTCVGWSPTPLGPAVPSPTPTTTRTTDSPPDIGVPAAVAAARDALASAQIVGAFSWPVAYDRDDYDGGGWADNDGDCQNNRHEVLIRDSRIRVTLSSNGCFVETGEWLDPYTGNTYTQASEATIDHVVPIAAAHRAGGWAWDLTTKKAFANDLDEPASLAVVGRSVNSSKGDRPPDQWQPPLRDAWCQYSIDWITIKTRWQLYYRTAEADALEDMLNTCDAGPAVPNDPVTIAPIVTSTTTVVSTTTTVTTRTKPANPGNTKNCGDFNTYNEAKAWFDRHFPYYGDVARLDSDNDGIPCESLR